MHMQFVHVHSFIYEVVSEGSPTVVVTASVKEDEWEAKVTLPKAYCISLPRDTLILFTRVLFLLRVSFCLRWMAKSSNVPASNSA
jgi:hypothetical protein